jgi:hypothetical protein
VLGHLALLERLVDKRVAAADVRAFKKVIAVVEDEAHALARRAPTRR